MADRFFCLAPSERGRIVLTGDEARHLARVRRLGVGDVVEVFDGRSREAERMAVVEVRRDEVLLESVGEKVADRMGPTGLVVASATPKGERFDWLVEKAVEVGVDRLVPIRSARSVVEPRAGKLDRQRRAIIEASKQCGRNRLMVLGSSMPLADYLAEETAGTRWIAHPGGLGFGSWPVGEGDDRALADRARRGG